MRNLLFGIGLVGILAACSASTTDVVVAENETEQKEVLAEVVPNRMLSLDIDGMVCQMGCGGSIRKELKATSGVGECNFDFKEGRGTNTATIEFDKELISADEITKIISEMNDGQFTVVEFSAIAFEKQTSESVEIDSKSSTTKDDAPVTMSSTSGFEMPNLLDIFSSLLTQ